MYMGRILCRLISPVYLGEHCVPLYDITIPNTEYHISRKFDRELNLMVEDIFIENCPSQLTNIIQFKA